MSFLRRQRRKLALLGALCAALVAAHFGIQLCARLTPPELALPAGDATRVSATLRRFGDSAVLERGQILEVYLRGEPSQIGYAHARLLYPEMVENEGILLTRFRQQVPSVPLRGLLLDLAELRYRKVDRMMSPERRAEIAAGARGFQPDPYSDVFPTYQRFVYLNALYDIALSFEHSPLIGCTTFTFDESASGGGGLLARAFDFEVDAIFDRKKAVFFVREDGKLPFASVAWPGLVGVVSGMNAEGVALVVHGARAGTPRAEGEPVVHALRRVLSNARSIEDATRLLAEQPPMVSHVVIVTDASGRSVAIERVPGSPDFVRALPGRAVTTNHLEGPSRGDAKNLHVRERTSTLARRERGEELLAALPAQVTARDAVACLRDRQGARGRHLELGDRDAINALIATHGVVMDTGRRVLWVSESPHMLGRFIGYDLRRMLAPDYAPEQSADVETIDADPLLSSGGYPRARGGD